MKIWEKKGGIYTCLDELGRELGEGGTPYYQAKCFSQHGNKLGGDGFIKQLA